MPTIMPIPHMSDKSSMTQLGSKSSSLASSCATCLGPVNLFVELRDAVPAYAQFEPGTGLIPELLPLLACQAMLPRGV
jgi:hypothetical protein